MLNPEIKEKWVAALRSGEYKQGTGSLRQSNMGGVKRYCCLGVLCDLTNPKGWIEPPGYGLFAEDDDFYFEDGSTNNGALNNVLREKIGLDDGDMDHLTVLNDDHKWSFSQIADYIEQKL